jgi:hypothetical protein
MRMLEFDVGLGLKKRDSGISWVLGWIGERPFGFAGDKGVSELELVSIRKTLIVTSQKRT